MDITVNENDLIKILVKRQGDERDWEFASARGINPNTWYKWRTGQRELGLEGCEILARAFADDEEVLAAIREYLVARVDAASVESTPKKKTAPLGKNGKK